MKEKDKTPDLEDTESFLLGSDDPARVDRGVAHAKEGSGVVGVDWSFFC